MPSKERYIKAAQRAERMAAAEAYLRGNYHKKTLDECAENLGVCVSTIRVWAKKWGLGGKCWTNKEKEHLAKVYSTCSKKKLHEIADERGVGMGAIRTAAHRLNVKRSPELHSKRGEQLGNSRRGRRKHSQELVDALRGYYPAHSRKECAEHFGISENVVQYIVSLYGIRCNRGQSYKKPRAFKLTDEQRRIIRERFTTTRTKELAGLLGLNYFKVLRYAHQMGLVKASDFGEAMSAIASQKTPRVRGRYNTCYTPGSIEAEKRDKWMRQHWAVTPDEQCSRYFGMNPRTIRRWAKRLGLKKDNETSWMYRRIGRVPSPEEMFAIGAYIAEHYPTEPSSKIAEVLGIGKATVCKYAKRLGVRAGKRCCGRHKKPVAQLDPETHGVVKVYYWCSPEDADGFTPRQKKQRNEK